MRCKVLSLLIIVVSLITIEYKVNKIDIINAQTEKKLVDKYKPKKVSKIKKVKRKSKEEKEVEYFSKLTGKKVIKVTKIDMKLSFYTDLDCENTSYGAVDCQGNKLKYGTIANNSYALGTKIYIKNYGLMTINDKGSSGLYNNNFDVFIPRNYGESSKSYFYRINNMGIRHAKGYILKFEEE